MTIVRAFCWQQPNDANNDAWGHDQELGQDLKLEADTPAASYSMPTNFPMARSTSASTLKMMLKMTSRVASASRTIASCNCSTKAALSGSREHRRTIRRPLEV